MELVEEIKKWFSNSDINRAYNIRCLDNKYPAYVIRLDSGIGVAIPYDGEAFSESFANVEIYSEDLNINGKNICCLILISHVEFTRNEFAVICAGFVDPGMDGCERLKILKTPIIWWKNMKYLIGNIAVEKKTYSVLAEMIVLYRVLKQGNKAVWNGINYGSHDITTAFEDYEVKSTLSRYEKIITIAGQFQLTSSRKLSIIFCRLEKDVNGIDIEQMVEKLVSIGENREDLEIKLKKIGYGIGRSARKEKYIVHEMLKYNVDDKFPRIVPELFITGKIPNGIKRITYDVDLSLVSGEIFDIG